MGIVMMMAVLAGCQRNTPYVYRGLPKQYEIAYEQIYGHCYDSIPHAVIGLDLYSDGLELDKNHKMKGTGYNLCITDIFVPDSLLEEGEYYSIRPSAIYDPPTAYSFLPGRDYEGTPHGMYLLYVEEGKLQSIQLLDSGSFVYRNDSLLFTLYYKNAYGGRAQYTPIFYGSLIPWVRQ